MKFRKLLNALSSVAIQLFLTQIAVAASALIVNVFAARALGPEARGELALFMQIAYVTNAVVVLGRHRSYLKLGNTDQLTLSSSHRDTQLLTRVPLVLSVITSLLVSALISDGLLSGLVFTIGMFALVYSGVQQKTLRASAIVSRNASPFFWSTVTGQVLLLVGSISLTLLNISDLSAWLILYGGAVMLPYLVLSLRFTIPGGDSRSTDEVLTHVKRLGIKLMPMSVAEIVGSRVDRFLIPILANFTQLGIYTVVVTMTELIAWPIKNYADSKVPEWARKISNCRFKVLKVSALISVAIFTLSFALGGILHWVLVPLFGVEYEAGKALIWPLVMAAALHAWAQFGTNLSLAAGFTFLVNAIPVAGMITSGISYIVLIPLFGALGAAWGLIIGYGVANVFSLVGVIQIARRNLRMNH